MKYIICDIDGTIADLAHRRCYVDGSMGKKDWDKFHDECHKDEPIWAIGNIVWAVLRDNPHLHLLYVTGRMERSREITETWLFDKGFADGDLRMRKDGDYRPDYIVKAELTADLKPEDVWFVLDDRTQVVNMWRERGFRCLQVAPGDF